jgi:hypothetical protein
MTMTMTTKLKVPARNLQPGDLTGSGETILKVAVGLHTPRGKVEVTLSKNNRMRFAIWTASTLINVTRNTEFVSHD